MRILCLTYILLSSAVLVSAADVLTKLDGSRLPVDVTSIEDDTVVSKDGTRKRASLF